VVLWVVPCCWCGDAAVLVYPSSLTPIGRCCRRNLGVASFAYYTVSYSSLLLYCNGYELVAMGLCVAA
jgi:hypothetical protein